MVSQEDRAAAHLHVTGPFIPSQNISIYYVLVFTGTKWKVTFISF